MSFTFLIPAPQKIIRMLLLPEKKEKKPCPPVYFLQKVGQNNYKKSIK